MSVLELTEIRRSYRVGEEALKGVSFRVEPGEIVGLLGRNGAGKTTLLRIAAGLLKPHAGEVRMFGLDPWAKPVEVKRRIGYVAEHHVVPVRATVRELLDFHRALFPTWDRELEKRLLGRLELRDGSRIDTLSKGDARKAVLICAMAHRPELLILDEPASGLDPATRREFLQVGIEILNSDGTAILFASHHLGDVERIAERVALVDDGRLFIDTTLASLQEDFTLAVLPVSERKKLEGINGSHGLVRMRDRDNAVYAVFSRSPNEVGPMLETELGVSGAQCARTSLEELFVALTGGSQ